jgi:Bacterial Ig-like domain/Putative esterase
MTLFARKKVKAGSRFAPTRLVSAHPRASRRLRLVVMGAVSVCLLYTLTASARVGTGAAAARTLATNASPPFPLSVRNIALRKQGGRIVGTATVVNGGNAPVRSTIGSLALRRGSGSPAMGVLTYSVPSLPVGAAWRVRFKSEPIRDFPVGSGTYEAFICTDVYSQIGRFAENTNCSRAGRLAISTLSARNTSGLVPDTVITKRPAAVNRVSSAMFRFASTVGLSRFECSLDGGPWIACTSPGRYTGLVDGQHGLAVRAVGPSGKADPTPAHASWSVDGHGPAVTLRTPASGSTTNDNKPAFSGAASAAPGDSSTIVVTVFSGASIAGLPVQTLRATTSHGNWTVAPTHPLGTGKYTAQAVQSDSVGNTGVSAPSTFTIGNASPANVSGPAPGGGPTTSTSSTPTSSTYLIGGNVSGLSGTVVLQDNGGDDVSLSSDGPFTFTTRVADGAAYSVSVRNSSSGETCTTSHGSGTVNSADVTNVAVTCVSSPTASAKDDFNRADGILGAGWAPMSDGGLSIVSQEVAGPAGALAGDIRSNETYGSDQYSQVEVTSTQLSGGEWIGPSVRSQNGGQDTYLGIYFWNYGDPQLRLYKRTGGNWTQLGASYDSGPLPAGTQLTLSAAGSTISFKEDGTQRISAIDTTLTGGAPGLMTYDSATADNWAAGMLRMYSVGGKASGLTGTVVLQDNGGDDLSISTDGPFTFHTSVADGAAYGVTVKTNPSGQTCTISDADGTVTSANVTDVGVTCAASSGTTSPMPAEYLGSDGNGVAYYDVTSPDNGYGSHILRVLAPTHPAVGIPHNFLYVLPVEPEEGTVFGDGLETLRGLDAQDQYNVTIIEPSFAIDPWYADNPDDPNLRYETFMTKDLVPWVTQNLAVTGHEQNWLIGFSKSGIGGADLLFRHPDLFAAAASWDFPAEMSSYSEFGSSSADEYGTDTNFQTNYRLTQSFVDTHKAPFLTKNRMWIGGYDDFLTDMADYNALLTSEGILHTTETPQQPAPHRWDSGWVPLALGALSQDGAALPSGP